MELILSITAFAFTATATPGPNNIMIMASGVNFGVLRSLPHLLGICFGFAVMVVLIGLGFGVVFQEFPILHEVIKIVGILYLLYLAWRIAKAGNQSNEQTRSKPFTFIQSALFQWLNPKAWIMGSSAIAAYTRVGEDIFLQVLLIAFIFLLVAFPSTGSWLVFGRTMQRFLQKPAYQNVFNISMALLLVATVIPVILELIEV
ncbi:MAG: LysE family translocator [Gammaproteobacteria bacterium]|nr:LysE family translocator [Gammaproteobacteria bacterium]